MAAGLSLNGFGGAGGLGKALAELVTSGAAEVDVQPYRPWRFGGPYRDPAFAAAGAREVYKYYYRLRYPLDVSEAGRPRRLARCTAACRSSAPCSARRTAGSARTTSVPGEPWRRAGEDQRAFGWTRPPFHDRVAVEHAAMRERVGIIDMSSFGKLDVSGADALALLERVCGNRIDRPVGAVVYTQLLDERGGIVGDVTVTRLADDRFRVVTGAGAVDSDRGWLELNRTDGDDVTIEDTTDDLAVIGIWGPEARDALAAVTDDDVSAEAFPFRTAKAISIGGAPVLAQRITYVGELGYELYVDRADAVQVWDAIVAAAQPEPVGYQALDSLRLEKAYRYFGGDITSLDTPYEAGLGFCVAPGKRPELDRDAAAAGCARSSSADEDYVTLYGGEAVHARRRRDRPRPQRRLRLHGPPQHRAREAAGGAGGGSGGGRRRLRRARAGSGRGRLPLRPGEPARPLLGGRAGSQELATYRATC